MLIKTKMNISFHKGKGQSELHSILRLRSPLTYSLLGHSGDDKLHFLCD